MFISRSWPGRVMAGLVGALTGISLVGAIDYIWFHWDLAGVWGGLVAISVFRFHGAETFSYRKPDNKNKSDNESITLDRLVVTSAAPANKMQAKSMLSYLELATVRPPSRRHDKTVLGLVVGVVTCAVVAAAIRAFQQHEYGAATVCLADLIVTPGLVFVSRRWSGSRRRFLSQRAADLASEVIASNSPEA